MKKIQKFLIFLIAIAAPIILFTDSLLAANQWTSMNAVSTAVLNGGQLVGFHSNQYIWVLIGGTNNAFYRYNTGNNTWTQMGDSTYTGATPINRNSGICWGGGDNIYVLRGQGTNAATNKQMSRYNIGNTTWEAATSFLALKRNTAMAMNSGGMVFAHPGNNTIGTYFRASSEGGSWATLAGMPVNAGNGADLVWGGGDYIYATGGGQGPGFYRYSISGNNWGTPSAWNAPIDSAAVSKESSLCWDGSDYIYALQGGATKGFWRFSISGNSWETLTDLPFTLANGSNYCGSRLSFNNNNVWLMRGEGETDFYRWGPVVADGSGTGTIDPDVAATLAGQDYNAFNITYTATATISGGQSTIDIPGNWTNPQKNNSSGAGYCTITNTGTIGTMDISGDTITVPLTTFVSGNYFIVEYGNQAGPAAGARPEPGEDAYVGTYTFTMKSKGSGGTLTPLSSGSPTVVVKSTTDNLLKNEFFRDWSSGTSGVPPDYWEWEGATGNIARCSTEACVDDYGTDYSTNCTANDSSTAVGLKQVNLGQGSGGNYSMEIWVYPIATGDWSDPPTNSKHENIGLGMRESGGSLDTAYYEVPTLNEWSELARYHGDSGTGTSLGLEIRLRNSVQVYIGAAWFGEGTSAPAWWPCNPTLVTLTGFQALGYEDGVWLWWRTASEHNNAGFNIYRSENRNGPYTKLNSSLIPGLGYSIVGRLYWYTDPNVIPGKTYYYKLEDVDFFGGKERHGPVWATPGIDSDDDGIPDGWEERYGLNPNINDGGLDPDYDGFTNYEEFLNDTDPYVPDIEGVTPPRPPEPEGPSAKGEGIEIIESDETGVTLELTTDEFDEEEKIEEGITYQRVSIPGYIHGHSSEIGKPQVPMKGVLLGVPTDSSIEISILDSESTILPDYNLYPVPTQETKESGDIKYVEEIFTKDEIAYTSDAFYPDNLTELGFTGYMREQKVVQIKLYPIQFNPVTNELKFYKKIRVRLDFSEVSQLASSPVHRFTGSPIRSLFSTPAWADPSPSSLPAFTGPTYKLSLDYAYSESGLYQGVQEGIYKLTYDYLQANTDLELDSLDPRTFKIYDSQGNQIRIYVKGESDGTFHSDDYIEFYGKIEPTKYTSTNVYWLDSGGTNDGLRMTTKDGTPDSGTTPNSFLSTEHYERDQTYSYAVTGAASVDRWFFSQTAAKDSPGDYTITLTDPLHSPSGNAQIKAALYSFFDVTHHTILKINNNVVEDTTWSGVGERSIDKSIPQSDLQLQDGINTITVQVILDPGVENDEVYANWFEIDYWRDFKASNNSLSFNQDAGDHLFEISDFNTNFTNNDIEVFDITNDQKINNFDITDGTLSFKDNILATTEYLAQEPLTLPASAIEKYEDSGIRSPNNRADYIIITYDDFYNENDPDNPIIKLKNHRESQGLRVKVVKVSDIYDEFNYGIVSPQAIKYFLIYAYDNWTAPKPTYVLLVGDATYDYKNNRGEEQHHNYLPVYLSETEYMGETINENWFVCVNDDNDDGVVNDEDIVPDIYIGRLPVKTTDDKLGVIVNKIVDYENAAYTDTWERNILYVADDAKRIGELIFETTNDSVRNYPSSDYQLYKAYLSELGQSACRQAIIDTIKSGVLIVNYVGHGAWNLWADETIFHSSDISSLNNEEKLPFFINMTCEDGYFAYYAGYECLAEELLRAKDDEEKGIGAIATFSSTGITPCSGQKILNEGLFQAFFGGTTNIIGKAISQAKMSALANGYEDVADTFGLLGDPALGLKFPPGEDGHTHGHTCPIASVAYGTSMAEEVEVFRNFRDECLLTNKTGRAFVRFYYHHSSSISKFIEKKKALKPIIRAGLKPILWLAKRKTRPPHKYPIWE